MYITRRLELPIKEHMFKGKVIIVYGARQVGKTTLVKKIAADMKIPYKYLNCDETDIWDTLQRAGNASLLQQLIGKQKLVIIDEAQRVKNIGLKLKLMADSFPEQQIIATGSSSFDLANEITEPLTGRNFEFWLFPVSIDEIYDGENNIEVNRRLESLLIYGGYPEIYQQESNEEKAQRIKYIASNYLYKDILKFSNIKNSEVVLKLLQALALQIGNEVSFNELATLVGVSRQTVNSYVELLEKAFILFRLPPFSRNLRKELGKTRKIYFYDLGIRNAIINNQNPLHLRDDVGKLWENFIISEKFKQQLGPGFKENYYFWRTYEGQEIDLVKDSGGKLTGWEVKWQNKSSKAPKAWTATYPNATWEVVNKDNFMSYFGYKAKGD